MKHIIQQLQKSNNVLLATHIHPDGDAIGSLLSMGLILDSLNKKTTLYCKSSIPAVYRFLPSVNRIIRKIDNLDCYDTAIILDCGYLDRIGDICADVSRIPVMINIDHHSTNTRFGNFQLIDTQACATAEIVYRLIEKMGVFVSMPVAYALYTGILTDTGSFRFSNTNRAAFIICGKMVELGVDPYNVSKHVYGTYSLGRIRLLNLALDSIEVSKNGKLSMMVLTQDMLKETDTHLEDGNDLINYAKIIEDVKVAVLIQEVQKNDNKSLFHVSLRSNGNVDVAKIAKSFGGGGHSNAAGFDVESTICWVKEQILEIAETL